MWVRYPSSCLTERPGQCLLPRPATHKHRQKDLGVTVTFLRVYKKGLSWACVFTSKADSVGTQAADFTVGAAVEATKSPAKASRAKSSVD